MKFLVIGNITKDTIRTGKKERNTFGGASSYGSITAKKLGWDSYVLSRGNHELNTWIKNLESRGIKVELERRMERNVLKLKKRVLRKAKRP